MVARAAFLAVLPEQTMREDQPGAIGSGLTGDYFANGAIGGGVILVLTAQEHSGQHAQSVRFQGEHGERSCEQQDFFRAGCADTGEACQFAEGLLERQCERAAQIALKAILNGGGDFLKPLRSYRGVHATRSADLGEQFERGRENFRGTRPDSLA